MRGCAAPSGPRPSGVVQVVVQVVQVVHLLPGPFLWLPNALGPGGPGGPGNFDKLFVSREGVAPHWAVGIYSKVARTTWTTWTKRVLMRYLPGPEPGPSWTILDHSDRNLDHPSPSRVATLQASLQGVGRIDTERHGMIQCDRTVVAGRIVWWTRNPWTCRNPWT